MTSEFWTVLAFFVVGGLVLLFVMGWRRRRTLFREGPKIMLMILRDGGGEMAGNATRRRYQDVMGIRVTLIDFYELMDKMERDGLVTSRDGPPSPQVRGGYRSKLFRVVV